MIKNLRDLWYALTESEIIAQQPKNVLIRPIWMPEESRTGNDELEINHGTIIKTIPERPFVIVDAHDRKDKEPRVDDQTRLKISTEIRKDGIEAMAWYWPAHYDPGHWKFEKWGIYIRESGILYLADLLETNGIEPTQATELAFSFLLNHEQFHGFNESVVTFQEMMVNRRFYRDNIDKINDLTIPQMEEALANAYAFKTIRGRAAKKILSVFSETEQPKG